MSKQKLVDEIQKYAGIFAASSNEPFSSTLKDECEKQLALIKSMIGTDQVLSNESMLAQLRQHYSARNGSSPIPHIITNERLGISDWQSIGSPHEWMVVERNGESTVLVDNGYGGMALFENGVLAGVGKDTITTSKTVVMNTTYFSTDKYIWK